MTIPQTNRTERNHPMTSSPNPFTIGDKVGTRLNSNFVGQVISITPNHVTVHWTEPHNTYSTHQPHRLRLLPNQREKGLRKL